MWEVIFSRLKKLEKAVSDGGGSGECHITKIEINGKGPLSIAFEDKNGDAVEIPAEYVELLDKAIYDGTPVLWQEHPLPGASFAVLFAPNIAGYSTTHAFSALSYDPNSGHPMFFGILGVNGDGGSRQYAMAAMPLAFASA